MPFTHLIMHGPIWVNFIVSFSHTVELPKVRANARATKQSPYLVILLPLELRRLLDPTPPEDDYPASPLEDDNCKPKALITTFATLAMVEASILSLLV